MERRSSHARIGPLGGARWLDHVVDREASRLGYTGETSEAIGIRLVR